MLQKEFQTVKITLMKGKYKDIIEIKQKINVNDSTFNIDMKECLDDQKHPNLNSKDNNNFS